MIRIIYTPKRVNISLYSLHSERGREGRRQKERQGETARDRGEERDREEDKVLTKTSKTGGDAPLEFLDAANLIPVLACKERYANFQRLGH